MISGSCSCNNDKGVGVKLVAVDVGFGLSVAVGGTGVLVACSGMFVSRAINRGRIAEGSVGEAAGLEKPGLN